ncbi:MAG: 2-dehydropantoate 2-reductase [Alphaproteobacteria bacterium]
MTTLVVVGAGAIGCHVGGALAASGAKVIFVARSQRAADLDAPGLVISDLEGRHDVITAGQLTVVATPAEAAARITGPIVILLAVKGGATLEAAATLGAAFPPGTPVISLQNGVDNVARIAAAAPALAPLAGMVPFNVVLTGGEGAPLTAHRATSGALILQDDAATRALLPAFEKAGLAATLSADMVAVQWGKLLLNLNNPVNALSGLTLIEELRDRDYRRVLAALQDEALAALKRAGLRPAKIGAAPPALIPTILRLPTWAFTRIAAGMLAMDPTARSSMADDLSAGRITEIDDLCGAVVRLSLAQGMTAPLNRAMVRLVGEAKTLTAPQMLAALGLTR